MPTYTIPGIYNALDPVLGQPGMAKTNSGAQNAASLQATIMTAINAGGGIVLIPAADANYATGPYQIEGSGGLPAITIPASAPPLLILGTSLGTTLLVVGSGGVFDVQGGNDVFFQDLNVEFNQTELHPLTGAAFSFDAGEFYGLFRVSIVNCEKPVVITAGQVYLLQCSASYTDSYPSGQDITVVSVTMAETFIEQCVFTFTGTPSSNQYGIVLGDATSGTGSSYARVVDTEIENFYTGIQIATKQGGSANKGAMFTNVRVLTPPGGTGLRILPNVYDVRLIECDFESVTAGTAHGIVIGAVGGGNESIDTIIFDSCTSKTSIDYGLQIEGGENIQVLGGAYSGNTMAGIAVTGSSSEIQINGTSCVGLSEPGTGNQGPQQYGIYIVAGSGVAIHDIQLIGVNCSGTGTSSAPGTGIYVSGTGVSDVRIDSAICQGAVFNNPSRQQYGVSVAGASGVAVSGCALSGSTAYGLYLSAVTNVTVSACDLFGNTSGGVSVNGGSGTQSQNVFIRNCNITGYSGFAGAITFAGTLATVEATNCAGYNDLAMPVTTAPPPNNHPFTAVSHGGYYGPVTFYTTGGGLTQIAIDGNNTNLTAGSFTLGTGDSATLSYSSVSGPTFIMIGE